MRRHPLALEAVGRNPTAISSNLQPERGFLVYIVRVVDTQNQIHSVVVDAGNGEVLSSTLVPTLDFTKMRSGPIPAGPGVVMPPLAPPVPNTGPGVVMPPLAPPVPNTGPGVVMPPLAPPVPNTGPGVVMPPLSLQPNLGASGSVPAIPPPPPPQ